MKRVLIVEDDPLQIKLMQRSLNNEDYEIYFINSGDQAIAYICELPPDLIVLDLNLPIVDGFEVIKFFEQNQDLRKIPIVVFTNISKQEIMNELLENGVDEFLIKSETTLNELNTVLKKHLNET